MQSEMAYLGIRTELVDPNWVEGEWLKVHIDTMDGKSIILPLLQDEFSVGMLKTMLWTKRKIPVNHQSLILEDVVLEDDKKLKDYKITNNARLTLVLTK